MNNYRNHNETQINHIENQSNQVQDKLSHMKPKSKGKFTNSKIQNNLYYYYYYGFHALSLGFQMRLGWLPSPPPTCMHVYINSKHLKGGGVLSTPSPTLNPTTYTHKGATLNLKAATFKRAI